MSVSPDGTKEDKVCLSEEQEKLMNHQVLTPGYIRNLTSHDTTDIPDAIVKLCTKFVKPIIFEEEAEDPVNFISNSDRAKCEQYKVEGNQYFKAKEFESAITKYTVAVRYDPNNHLIFSNRSYCHYLLGNYDDALSDIKECVRIQPAFIKGWFRYGLILEKLELFGKAGMAYKTACNLSQYEMKQSPDDEAKKRTLMLCKHRYLKFMKMLKRENKEDALKYINDFGSNHIDRQQKIMESISQIEEQENGAMDPEQMESVLEDSFFEQLWEEQLFVKYIEQSRFRHYANGNKFRFYDGEEFEWYNHWGLSWSSTSCIEQNKRDFMVSVCSGEFTTDTPCVFGKPNAEQIVDIILRAITFTHFNPLPPMKCIKPRSISFSWRMKDEFAEIESVLERFGIYCELDDKEKTEWDCVRNGTRPDGYNHL